LYSIAAKYVVAVTIVCTVIVYVETGNNSNDVTVSPEPNNATQTASALPPPVTKQDPDELEKLIAEMSLSDEQLEQEITGLLRQSEFKRARVRLMEFAGLAVEEGDKKQLGHVMTLLGQVAIEEQDLDNAEVYLLEALDVYEGIGDEVGSANVYVQLGKSHLKSRQMARTAGHAYDRLLIARWQFSHKHYMEAENNLRLTIDDNLAVNRYGAAASAYDTLVNVYTQLNNTYQAEMAAAESAKLYAASGQLSKADAVLSELELVGIEPNLLLELKNAVVRQYAEFNASIEQIERAKDYERLYNHYRAKGDTQRAWKLRVQANRSLAKISKRAMYHRQPDVLAVLHNSNNDMERAQNYLSQAEVLFIEKGLLEDIALSQSLSRQIY